MSARTAIAAVPTVRVNRRKPRPLSVLVLDLTHQREVYDADPTGGSASRY